MNERAMTHLPADDILDLLRSLVDKSLVIYEEHDGAGRYRLLETVRQYGRDRLLEGDGETDVRRRHAAWFLSLAEAAEPQVTGPEQALWLKRLETEHDNLRAALDWFEHPDEAAGGEAGLRPENGLRLAGALWRFWLIRGHYSEGRRWLGRTLGRTSGREGTAGSDTLAVRSKALSGAGVLAEKQGDLAEARAFSEESLAVYRQLDNPRGVAAMLGNLGNIAESQGDYAAARALHEESLAIEWQQGNPRGIANALSNLGNMAFSQGDLAEAMALHEESLAIKRQLGDQRGIANSLGNLGVAKMQGDLAGARVLHEESLAIKRQLGDQQGIANSLTNLGIVAESQGDLTAARVLYEESLAIARQLGDPRGIAEALSNLGNMAFSQGHDAYLTYRGLETRDFEACQAMMQGRAHYSEEAWAALPAIWRQWLGSGSLSASVMELGKGSATPQIVQFGMSVFVTDQFMAAARTAAGPHLGVDLIRRVMAGQSPVLDLAGIRAANSGAGLNLLVCHFGVSSKEWTPNQEALLVNRMPESFFWLHEGYNFREMLQEYYDVRIVQFCLAAGFLRRQGSADSSPQVMGITREEAAANPGTYIAKIFPYHVPRFFFSYGEQKVLLQALLGRNDEEIASLLDVALSTVKKRWAAIYDRASDQVPEILPDATLTAISPLQTRGGEKRRYLLAYLRQHPEELRPSLPRTAGT